MLATRGSGKVITMEAQANKTKGIRIHTLPFDLNNSIDKSWMRTSRTKKQHIDGVEAFIKYAVHNLQNMMNINPREIPTDGPTTIETVNATKESFDEDDLAKFQELLLDTEKPLYKGYPDFTKLSAIVKLLNLKDSQAWRTIDEKFPKIAKDPRNLRLGISADGVDVNSGTRHHKSLVDDLHSLFETGVDTYDASTKINFNLRAVVLWVINDYLALGILCGYPYSGFKGCVVCGKDTHCVRLSASSKQSFVGLRRYLPYNHSFRRQKKAFNGKQEFQLAPNPLTGEQIYNE
nr:hypothetical protein [Tanacetum cinerariifolium]